PKPHPSLLTRSFSRRRHVSQYDQRSHSLCATESLGEMRVCSDESRSSRDPWFPSPVLNRRSFENQTRFCRSATLVWRSRHRTQHNRFPRAEENQLPPPELFSELQLSSA